MNDIQGALKSEISSYGMIPPDHLNHGELYRFPINGSKKKNGWCVPYFNDDGTLTVNFRVDGLGEVSWWILGYGDQVRILAPRALRKRVVDIAKNMIKINGKGYKPRQSSASPGRHG